MITLARLVLAVPQNCLRTVAQTQVRLCLKAAAFGASALAHLRRCPGAALEHLLFCRETVAERDRFEPVWVPT